MCATGGPLLSTYLETYGGAKVGAGRQRPSSAPYKTQPIKYREVTCPFGAVNPHTAMADFRPAYPVPEGFLRASQFPQPGQDATMYRLAYGPRDPEAVSRSLHAAAEMTQASHKALLRSTLPLGRNGINMVGPADWVTEHAAEFVPHALDVRGAYESAQALKAAFTGPTASVGKVATLIEGRT